MTTYPSKKARVPQDCYVAYDGQHSVKYVVIDNYLVNSEGTSFNKGFSAGIADWIIWELTANDGYDVVILCHWPFYRTHKTRSMNAEETVPGSSTAENYNSATQTACWNLLLARKNKQSGTYTDYAGGSHSYDFTGCDTDLLCVLSGHTHEERWSIKDGLTNYAEAGMVSNQSSVFGLIDRSASKMHIWRFDNTSTEFAELILDI